MESLARRLVRRISKKKVGKETTPSDLDRRRIEALEKALDRWVKAKGYHRPHRTVNETAGELGTDGVQLHHYFQERMHVDFRTWRTRLRLEEAKRLLLEEPETTAAEIARRVGFSNRSNFSHQFLASTGLTPAQWRKEARTSPDVQAPNDYECLTKD